MAAVTRKSSPRTTVRCCTKKECPQCGQKDTPHQKVVLVTEQGHKMCEECARFVRIAGTKLQEDNEANALSGTTHAEAAGLVTAGAVGLLAAPVLNERIEARPLGRYVPPSAALSVVSLVGASVARRARWHGTASAAAGLGVGLGAGTLLYSKRKGGLLATNE